MPNFQFAILVSALFVNTGFIVGDSSAWLPLGFAFGWLAVALLIARRDNR